MFAVVLLAACDDDGQLTARNPSGEFAPSSVDFGEVPIGLAADREVAIRNTGEVNLTIDDVLVPSGFSVQRAKGLLIGNTIAPGNEIAFDVTFLPTVEGQRQGTLTVLSAGIELELDLAGSGVFRQFSNLVVDPAAVDFGTVSVNGSARAEAVITNIGNAEASVTEVMVGEPAVFAVNTPVPFSVPAGQAVIVGVSFTPNRVDLFSDTMRFVAADSFVEVGLSGRSIQPNGDVLCMPSTVNFGQVKREDMTTRGVTCTAVGGPARILRTEVAADGSDDFSLTTPSQLVDLRAGQSLTFVISFEANGLIGARTGTLLIQYDGGGGPNTVFLPLEAEVVAPPASENDISIVLRWDTGGTDVDIHLVRPGGAFFTMPGDCYYANRSPDWGTRGESVDDPFLDMDNTTGFGPETINLMQAEPGQYQVWTHFYQGPFATTSNATVDVFLRGQAVGSYTQPLTCSRRWLVGFINWNGSTGSFVPDDFQSTTSFGRCVF